MSFVHRRIGPINLGIYGFLSSIINGVNLFIVRCIIPRSGFNLFFMLGILPFMFFSFLLFLFNSPYFITTVYFTVIVIFIILGFIILFLVFLSIIPLSKFNYIGTFRVISQQISFELLSSTIFIIFIFYSYWVFIYYFNDYYFY